MCGSSGSEKQIEQQQQQQYQTLANNYQQEYGQDQGILNGLTASLNPIIQAGPSQQGFSSAQLNDLNSQATENTAQGYGQAQQALQENQAAGGGASYIPSGAQSAERAGLLSQGAGQLASEKNQIGQANYSQGNANYNNAVGAEQGVAGLLNPTAAGNSSISGGSAAANSANQIAQQSNSMWGSVLGALGGVAGAATGVGGLSSLGSMFGGGGTQTMDPFGGQDPLGLNSGGAPAGLSQSQVSGFGSGLPQF